MEDNPLKLHLVLRQNTRKALEEERMLNLEKRSAESSRYCGMWLDLLLPRSGSFPSYGWSERLFT